MSVETPCPERTHGADLQVAKELAFGKAAGSGAVPQNEGCGTDANPEGFPGAPEGAPRGWHELLYHVPLPGLARDSHSGSLCGSM